MPSRMEGEKNLGSAKFRRESKWIVGQGGKKGGNKAVVTENNEGVLAKVLSHFPASTSWKGAGESTSVRVTDGFKGVNLLPW